METLHLKSRLQLMQHMVFEMAQGNFRTRIPLLVENDELKAVEVLVNMLAEELHAQVSLAAYRKGNQLFAFPPQSTLLLDNSLVIIDCTPELVVAVESFLGNLIGQELSVFLIPESDVKLRSAIHLATEYPQVLHLDCKGKDDLVLSVTCSLSKLKMMNFFVLNLAAPRSLQAVRSIRSMQADSFSAAYYRLMMAVQHYVLSHLAAPLPALPTLATLFGTNEHKLKAGFKHCFGTGVYQFYHEERLKRSFTMVQLTVLPLQEVAQANGFKTYQNFCRAFKNRFGTSASDLRRQDPLHLLSSKL